MAIPNITSCDGITAADSLSAFYWNCFVGTDSSVSVISTGLRGDKGLSDLIDFTSPGSWRSNTVTVSYNGITHLTTSAGKWWDNTITVNNTGGGLSTSKTVYIINDGSSAVDYRINTVGTNKIALLVQPGILKPLTAGTTAINVTDNSFLWIEGNFRAVTSNAVLISFQSSGGTNKFNVLRKFKGIGNGGYVIANNASSASLFTNVSGTNLAATGGNFLNMNNTKNIINNFRVYNTSANGLEISQSDLIVLNSMVMNSGTISFLSNGMTYANNILINNSSLNSGSSGVSFTGGTVRPTTVNLLTANTGGATSALDVFSTSPKFINTIAAHSGGITHYADNAGTENSVFNGILKTSSASCLSSGTSPGVNSSCAKINGSETGVPSVTNISLSSSFVGQITSSDSKNTGNTNGASSFPPADWLDFENQFRGWGKQGSFPASAVTGRCSTGTCQIWDLSLKSSDTAARNVNACPSGTAVDTHIWSDASAGSQAYCDANYKGSKLNGTTCVTAFLRNAVEIFGDGIGNENGICESGEDCLYTPNIGIYQGHSSDSSNPYKLVKANTVSSANTNLCSDIGSGGTITNVTLWKYDTNGY